MADKFTRRDTRRGNEPESFSDPKLGEVHTQLAREKEEPREGFSGVPIIVVFVFCALGFFGSVYIAQFSGAKHFDANTYVMAKEVEASGDTGPKSVEKQIKDGEKLYNQNCATCHQADGKGTPGSFPPLAGSPFVAGAPDRVIKIANSGIGGEIEVEGHKFNGAMPNIGESLSDQKLADLLTYVRQAWGNKAEAVEKDKVNEVRKETGKRGPWTPAEIIRLHPLEK